LRAPAASEVMRMSMKSESGRTMATAAGTLVAQVAPGTEPDVAAFEAALDRTGVLRRTGTAEVRTSGERAEVRCAVAYGPVFGCHESDLRRQLRDVLQRSGGRLTDGAVFHFQRRTLTPEALAAVISELDAQVDDVSLPLAARERLAKDVARLRAQLEAR
jgi:hypothetical protein